MGIIDTAQRAARDEGPQCPSLFIPLFEKYRELKFTIDRSGETFTLYPRNQLQWQDLVAYKEATQQTISIHEAELIMGIDAIFEGRDNV